MVTAKYLVDTDWAVYYLRGKESFVAKLQEYFPHGLALSIITVAELYEGIFRSPRPDDKESALLRFLQGFTILDISQPIARLFGQNRAFLREKGLTVSDFDLLIACTARTYNLLLLTNNRRHYEKVLKANLIISLDL